MLNWVQARGPTGPLRKIQSCSWLCSASSSSWVRVISCVLWIRLSSNISLDFGPVSVPSALTSAIQPRPGRSCTDGWPSGTFSLHHKGHISYPDISPAGFLSRPALERILAASASSMSECWSPMWGPSTQQKLFSRSASQCIPAPELWRQIFWPCHIYIDVHFQPKLDSGVHPISWTYGSWTPAKAKKQGISTIDQERHKTP